MQTRGNVRRSELHLRKNTVGTYPQVHPQLFRTPLCKPRLRLTRRGYYAIGITLCVLLGVSVAFDATGGWLLGLACFIVVLPLAFFAVPDDRSVARPRKECRGE